MPVINPADIPPNMRRERKKNLNIRQAGKHCHTRFWECHRVVQDTC
jgi:hypothetical protein